MYPGVIYLFLQPASIVYNYSIYIDIHIRMYCIVGVYSVCCVALAMYNLRIYLYYIY